MRDRDRLPVALKSVGILAFDDVDVLDLCGPFQVFCAARRERSNARLREYIWHEDQ